MKDDFSLHGEVGCQGRKQSSLGWRGKTGNRTGESSAWEVISKLWWEAWRSQNEMQVLVFLRALAGRNVLSGVCLQWVYRWVAGEGSLDAQWKERW